MIFIASLLSAEICASIGNFSIDFDFGWIEFRIWCKIGDMWFTEGIAKALNKSRNERLPLVVYIEGKLLEAIGVTPN